MNDTSIFLASILGPSFLIIGLSFLIYPKQWKNIVSEFTKNHFIFAISGMISLFIGLLIIQIHNVWEFSPWVIITLTGWGAFLKGIFIFLAPESWIKKPMSWYVKTNLIYGDGVFVITLGAILSYYVYMV